MFKTRVYCGGGWTVEVQAKIDVEGCCACAQLLLPKFCAVFIRISPPAEHAAAACGGVALAKKIKRVLFFARSKSASLLLRAKNGTLAFAFLLLRNILLYGRAIKPS